MISVRSRQHCSKRASCYHDAGPCIFFHILAARLAVDRLPRSLRLQPSIRETALDYILSSYSSDRGFPYSVRYCIFFALVVSRSCLIYSCDTDNRVSHSFSLKKTQLDQLIKLGQ